MPQTASAPAVLLGTAEKPMNYPEAAELLGIKAQTLMASVYATSNRARGRDTTAGGKPIEVKPWHRVPFYRLGRRVLFDRAELLAFREELKRETGLHNAEPAADGALR